MEKGESKRRREKRREKRETAVGGVHQPALENTTVEPQIDTAVSGTMVNTDKLVVLLHIPFLHVPLQCHPQSQSCARMTKKKSSWKQTKKTGRSNLCSAFDSSPLKYSPSMISASVLSWQPSIGSCDPSASSFSISALGESSRWDEIRRANTICKAP